MIRTYTIRKFRNNVIEEVQDEVAEETPLTIFLNGLEFITMVCTPNKQEYLALGFLRSEGFIESPADLESHHLEPETGRIWITLKQREVGPELLDRKRMVTSGCARGVSFYNYQDALRSIEIKEKREPDLDRIFRLMRSLQERSELYLRTGGVHSAGLAGGDSILIVAEDIGRHNAVDKIIGEGMMKGISFSDKILLSSGRVSSEIILKSARVGIPILVSRAAPTSMSVNIARELNMSLIGFMRGSRANIYS